MNENSGSCGWRKSSYSSAQTNCVEVGWIADGVAVRDTKNRTAGHLVLDSLQWSLFILSIKSSSYGG
ncbi:MULTISPECIES: DUF397 domain-containing protein [unclassified Saccharopolyspora]|uniref:DUF397 domain-containing protein n=1 Tax=unclassified Saccharopolyspora TaxID=2646250 RepID=UPI001CD57C85|nr:MULTISPECIES: DUF397 domain-containing protein [unclassified Saccharopolyspora]MCA1185111.1 DUF397 domain-containing protein [Saccharopolyspora sp. 6T]MCA1191413.1 DUF397 domain-containing protein [Saccharopolyspora sp. 6V]MCA1224986.1 DUF397 domain-containing protein [Saccharopolyspora sp. 6M]MCA1278523.1 DUF397 domain-containing protein [Saccharopolyspora sp. 7B]